MQSVLQAMVVIPDRNRREKSKTEEGNKVRIQISDNDWLIDCGYLVSLL